MEGWTHETRMDAILQERDTLKRDLAHAQAELKLANLQFEEARKIIEQVSHAPEFKKHFYDGSWQDPCGVHAFTEKHTPKCGEPPGHCYCGGCVM